MGGGAPELDELIASELSQPAPEAARHLADEIRRRHGDAVASIAFYGSCLRKRTREGVLDFYVLVDDYRAAYGSRALVCLNTLMPPNVFYLEIESPLGTLRSKYAVVSTSDFEKATSPSTLRTGIWARFSQPALLVYARDAEARQSLLGAAVAAVTTVLKQGLSLLPGEGDTLRFGFDDFWQNTLRETYSVEMRSETPETIRGVYRAAPARFDRIARAGLDRLAEAGWLQWRSEAGLAVVTLPAGRRRAAARRWRWLKPLRKTVYLIQLLKSAATFGDWLPYVLWKLERHSGTPIVLSDRQRRHPLIWGWPVFLRVLRRRDLH